MACVEDAPSKLHRMRKHSMSQHRLLAFYLPQFHPTPENDLFWGAGFTEWHNVVRGRPLYFGHYQPHLPADLGFYDLRLDAVRQAQANLARMAGLHGFCYYHYWFGGQRPLGRVIDAILHSKAPDLPFCLAWANQSWTRNWGGGNAEVLLRQSYGPQDDVAHMRWLLRVFEDPRYIRIAGCPLLVLYRAHDLPNLAHSAHVWRAMAQAHGFAGLYLAAVQTRPTLHPSLDASIGFAPRWDALGPPRWPGLRGMGKLAHGLAARALRGTRGWPTVHAYSAVMRRALREPDYAHTHFRGLTPGFDNSARHRQAGSTILHGATPEGYGAWLAALLARAPPSAEENFIFINAWNEWAEGCHLEPDQRFGHGFLRATQMALQRNAHDPSRYPTLLPQSRLHLGTSR